MPKDMPMILSEENTKPHYLNLCKRALKDWLTKSGQTKNISLQGEEEHLGKHGDYSVICEKW